MHKINYLTNFELFTNDEKLLCGKLVENNVYQVN